MEYNEVGILKTFNSPKAIKDKGIIEVETFLISTAALQLVIE